MALAAFEFDFILMEAVCVMYTNSVNMELGPGHGAATAFYPVFAHMNHDCGCNTQTVKLPRCRALAS